MSRDGHASGAPARPPALEARYHVDFRCNDDDPLQRELNRLYEYERDIPTKVLHRSRLNLFDTLTREMVRDGTLHRFGSAIDVGCNAGYYSKMIADLGFRDVLGVDVGADMIAHAREAFERDGPTGRVHFEHAGVESLPNEPTFDFLLCTEVIEHTERPLDTVARLARALGRGGIAVISLPNAWSMPFLTARLIYRLRSKPRDPVFEEHLRYPFPRSESLFREHGLELVRTSGANVFFDDHVLGAVYGTPLFAGLHRLNFALARRAPLKYVAQFYFMVWRKPEA